MKPCACDYTFGPDLKPFVKRTQIRLIVDLMIWSVVAYISIIVLSELLPNWLQIAINGIAFFYIAGNILLYPMSKKRLASCEVKVYSDRVVYSFAGMATNIMFSEIDKIEPIPNLERIQEIKLVLKDRYIVNLGCLERMDVLYELILKSANSWRGSE
ncbi:hypothetical protein SAMN05216210_0957 [Halopseudomonas salegens]|uniref:PH domain-containing protein n=1 Tax=Halopseudomonas salegens TaxID=1434072 RepID=A0A1H2EQU6_9GAMM|nr:hypothetical protein SAMN05216210_0957 [Halopseudomonas salegens]